MFLLSSVSNAKLLGTRNTIVRHRKLAPGETRNDCRGRKRSSERIQIISDPDSRSAKYVYKWKTSIFFNFKLINYTEKKILNILTIKIGEWTTSDVKNSPQKVKTIPTSVPRRPRNLSSSTVASVVEHSSEQDKLKPLLELIDACYAGPNSLQRSPTVRTTFSLFTFFPEYFLKLF